jgi:hypothetical protein
MISSDKAGVQFPDSEILFVFLSRVLTWHVDRYNTNNHYGAVAAKNNNDAVDRQGNDRLLVKQSLGAKKGIKDDEGRTTRCRDVSRNWR